MSYQDTHPRITFELDLRHAPPRFWMLLGEACSKCEYIAGIPLSPQTSELLHQASLERGSSCERL